MKYYMKFYGIDYKNNILIDQNTKETIEIDTFLFLTGRKNIPDLSLRDYIIVRRRNGVTLGFYDYRMVLNEHYLGIDDDYIYICEHIDDNGAILNSTNNKSTKIKYVPFNEMLNWRIVL